MMIGSWRSTHRFGRNSFKRRWHAFEFFFNVLNVDIPNGGAATAIASLWVSLFFSWLRLCQDQARYAQPEGLGCTNRHTTTKKSCVAVLTFEKLFLKIYIINLGALPQLCYAFKHLLNITNESFLSLRRHIGKKQGK